MRQPASRQAMRAMISPVTGQGVVTSTRSMWFSTRRMTAVIASKKASNLTVIQSNRSLMLCAVNRAMVLAAGKVASPLTTCELAYR